MNSDRKRYEEAVIRDNLFHQRLSDIRNNTLTDDHLNAMAELNRPASRSGFGQVEPVASQTTYLTEADVERIAFFDDVAPVYNFRYLMRKLDREMKRSKRYNRPLSICIVGFPSLGLIRMNYGELAFDNILVTVGEQLLMSTRLDVDMVGRYGDDRFILVLPETPGNGAAVVGERITRKFQTELIKYQWHELAVNACMGISYFPGHGTEAQELVAKADLACDIANDRGGKGFCFCPE